jgi:hypothetical protein
MLKRALILVVACHSAPERTVATHESALAAYDAKNYPLCAEQFAATAKTVAKDKRGDELYSSACCYALASKKDSAFAMIDQAIDAGFRSNATLDKDTDIDSLRTDPRWPKLREHETAAIAAWEGSLGQPALRRELLKMVEEDQRVRFEWIEKSKKGEQTAATEMEAVDVEDLVDLHRIVAESGWPTVSMVGDDGAHAAWLMLQHADKDVAFQKQILEQMKKLSETGEVSEVDFAYLEDRVAVNEHRKQSYGTQFDDHQQPKPIEDEANVDARRKAVGMGTMAEYRVQMRKMYGDPK